MSGGKKTALSLLVSVILFAAFIVVAFSDLFNLIEINFYQPRLTGRIEENITGIEQTYKEYTDLLIQRFQNYAAENDIRSFLAKESDAQIVKNRSELTGTLFNETTGLFGIRLLDNTGRHIHFSTFTKAGQDQKDKTNNKISYNDYAKLETQPYSKIEYKDLKPEDSKDSFNIKYYVSKDKDGKLAEKCIIYAIPFLDENDAIKGTFFFYCDESGFNRYLLSKNQIGFNGTGTVLIQDDCSSAGIVFGLPEVTQVNSTVLEEKILSLWATEAPLDVKEMQIEGLASNETRNLHLFTIEGKENFYISYVYDDTSLEMPSEAKVLLLAVIYLTLFLFIFLLLSLKHDDMTIIKDRIKRFQLAFITEYLDKKDKGELTALPQGLSERKLELSNEIKKSLGRRGKRNSQEVEKLLESSWNEILTALGVKTAAPLLGNKASIDAGELRRILEDILGSGKVKIAAASVVQTATAAPVQITKPEPQKPGAKEILEEVEELDEVESLDEVEEIEEAEPLDEVEEIEEAEPLDEVEEIEEAESLDEVEELDEAESLEEVEKLDEVESLDEVEEIEEAESLDVVEEIEETEPLDVVEEIEETEPLDVVEEIEETEPLDEVEEIEEAEPLDEVEEIEEAESLDEVEEIDEAESLDEVEEIEETEPLDVVEKIEETEPLDEIEEEPSTPVSENKFIDVANDNFIEEKQVEDNNNYDDLMDEEMTFSSPSAHPESEQTLESPEIEDFNIKSMDFSFLDSDNESDQFIEEPDEKQIKAEFVKEAVEKIKRENSYLTEPQSVDEETTTEDFTEDDIHENIFINLTDDEGQPENTDEKAEISIETEELEEVVDEVKPLESKSNQNPFMFTTFAANNDNITELESEQKDTIVEESDGTYSIHLDDDFSSVEIDSEFKKLVDSVLK